ncbi:MAG: hypothetical protein ACTSWQ_09205 [Candidatus Thorarchaeota archaeon]
MELRNPFKKEEVFELLEPSSGKIKGQNAAEVPTSILDTNRKDPILLENMFATEPILLAGCMTWQMLIQDADFKVFVDDEFTQSEIDDIFRYTRLKNEMLEKLPLHFGIFGGWGLEHIQNRKKKIVDFISLDPKLLFNENAGFLKFGMFPNKLYNGKRGQDPSQVIVDNLGVPVGMRKYYNWGDSIDYKFPRDLTYRPYLQVTHTQLGYGFVEASYRDSELKENVEHGRVQASIDVAYPKPLVKYGSQFFRPTAEMKGRAETLAGDLANPEKDWIAYSGAEFEVSWKEPPDLKSNLIEQVMYNTRLQAAVLRIPVAMLIQTGADEGGKNTLDTLVDFFEYSFRGFQARMKPHEICKQVLEHNSNYWDEETRKKLNFKGLRTEYGVLTHKAKKEFVMSIQRMGKTDLIDKDDPEVKRAIRKALGLRDLEGIDAIQPVPINHVGDVK